MRLFIKGVVTMLVILAGDHAVYAEDNWALVQTGVFNPDFGGSTSFLSIGQVEEDQENAVFAGRLVRETVTPIQVELPTSLIESINEDGGSIPTENGPIEISLVASFSSLEEPSITTRIFSMQSQSGDRGTLTIHDDPFPLIPLAIIGGSYMLICGALYVYSVEKECEQESTLNIGLEAAESSYGCTVTCG